MWANLLVTPNRGLGMQTSLVDHPASISGQPAGLNWERRASCSSKVMVKKRYPLSDGDHRCHILSTCIHQALRYVRLHAGGIPAYDRCVTSYTDHIADIRGTQD